MSDSSSDISQVRQAKCAIVPESIFQILRFNKVLGNHFTIEDLTGNNKEYASGVEISNDFKLLAGNHSNELSDLAGRSPLS